MSRLKWIRELKWWNLPAFVNKQKDHKTEKTTKGRCDSDPGHNVVGFVKFDFQLLPLAEGRRRFRQERRRVHPPRRHVAYVHVAAYDTPHTWIQLANSLSEIVYTKNLLRTIKLKN